VPLAAATVDDRVRTRLAVAVTALCFLVLPDGYNLARATVLPGILLDVAVVAAVVVLAVVVAARRRARVSA
jgi:alpha-1,6-mannosyltransferase